MGLVYRRGSRINTDPSPRHAPREFFFLTPQSRFSWVSESFSQDIGRILTWKVFFMKIYLSMKTLTDFRKTVETGVDPRLGLCKQ